MASPAAPTESSKETARRSLIAISRSVPEIGEALNIKSPHVVTANGRGEGAEKCRSELISISNRSPDAQTTSSPPKNSAA